VTDFRAVWDGTIMGPAGLTAVFGMGTGVAPPVWSPGNPRRAVQGPAAALWRPVAGSAILEPTSPRLGVVAGVA
jgi:hypothetical protein